VDNSIFNGLHQFPSQKNKTLTSKSNKQLPYVIISPSFRILFSAIEIEHTTSNFTVEKESLHGLTTKTTALFTDTTLRTSNITQSLRMPNVRGVTKMLVNSFQ
jgi:hypothetical protein